jgi:hypothetical protein
VIDAPRKLRDTPSISPLPTSNQTGPIHYSAMILFLTKSSDEIGKIKEHLKWGAPSYVTHTSKSGSTLIKVFSLVYLDFNYNKKC